MSDDLLTDDDLRTERAPLKEPPKRWRNLHEIVIPDDRLNVGDRYWGAYTYPSKEIAQQRAWDEQARIERMHARAGSRYVGAFPDETDKL